MLLRDFIYLDIAAMSDTEKIKVALRVRPFNRRGG